MKKRRAILFLLIFAVVITFVIVWFSSSLEPRYQGKRLTEWWDEFREWPSDTLAEYEVLLAQLTNVVRGIGAEGLPFYADCLNFKSSPDWYGNLSRWVAAKSSDRIRLPARQDRTAVAYASIEILGPIAAPIIPDLVQVSSESGYRRDYAIGSLAAIGPAALPALSNILVAAAEPGDRIKILAMIGNMGAGAQPMTPLFREWIRRHESPKEWGAVAVASLSLKVFAESETNRSLVMPQLVTFLTDTNLAPGAAFALARMGPEGMPLLFQAVTNRERAVCVAAAAALATEFDEVYRWRRSFYRVNRVYSSKLGGFHYSPDLGEKIESVLLRYRNGSNEQYRVAANLALEHFRAVGYPTNSVGKVHLITDQ